MTSRRFLVLAAILGIVAVGTFSFLRPHPAPRASGTILVYYTKPDGRTVAPWRVTLGPARDRESVAFYAAEQALAGPASEVEAIRFPPGTTARSVSLSGSTATVDLDKAAAVPQAGSFTESGEFKALVWTLTALPGIKRVAIKIDGAKVALLPGGHLELDEPLDRSSRGSLLLGLTLWLSAALPADARPLGPDLWFAGSPLFLDHPQVREGDIAVSTDDDGLRRFLHRLGAEAAYSPGQRYVIVTSADRRTIVFTLGDARYNDGTSSATASFRPFLARGEAFVPLFALARALDVQAVVQGRTTILEPQIGG